MAARIKGRQWLILTGCVLLCLALVWARFRASHQVLVAKAYVGPLVLQIAASGLVETKSSDLSFRGAGQIVGLYVEEGDAVSQSAVLARLSGSGASSALSAMSVPSSTFEVTEVIQAPFDGTVVDVYLREGAVASPGQPVLRLASSEPPWVTAFIDSEQAAYIRPGDRFACRTEGYLSEPLEVVVRSVGKEAVPRRDFPGSVRQVRVRCDPVDSGLALATGANVDVDGEITLAAKAVLIPTAAIIHDGPHDRVFVVEGDRVSLRDVRVGPNNFDFIEIRENLQPGETVVVHGKEKLRDHQRVRAKPMPRPIAEPSETY